MGEVDDNIHKGYPCSVTGDYSDSLALHRLRDLHLGYKRDIGLRCQGSELSRLNGNTYQLLGLLSNCNPRNSSRAGPCTWSSRSDGRFVCSRGFADRDWSDDSHNTLIGGLWPEVCSERYFR